MVRGSLAFGALAVVSILLVSCMQAGKEGVTPLMLAARAGNVAELDRLLGNGAKVDKGSRYDWTALIFASGKGKSEAVSRLLKAGANVNVVSGRVPAAFMATRGGHSPTTALREAIENNHLEVANLLLDHGAIPDPVSFACAGGVENTSLMSRMIALGANVNQVSELGYLSTALCVAARDGGLESVKWLIGHGADPNLVAHRRTALGEAVGRNEVEVVRYLLAHGADPNLVAGRREDSALDQANYYADHEDTLSIIKLLLDHGADKNRGSYGGRTVLESLAVSRSASLRRMNKAAHPKSKERHAEAIKTMDDAIRLLQ